MLKEINQIEHHMNHNVNTTGILRIREALSIINEMSWRNGGILIHKIGQFLDSVTLLNSKIWQSVSAPSFHADLGSACNYVTKIEEVWKYDAYEMNRHIQPNIFSGREVPPQIQSLSSPQGVHFFIGGGGVATSNQKYKFFMRSSLFHLGGGWPPQIKNISSWEVHFFGDGGAHLKSNV